jgi:hypothetical protein
MVSINELICYLYYVHGIVKMILVKKKKFISKCTYEMNVEIINFFHIFNIQVYDYVHVYVKQCFFFFFKLNYD